MLPEERLIFRSHDMRPIYCYDMQLFLFLVLKFVQATYILYRPKTKEGDNMELIKWLLYALIFATSTTIGILHSQKYQKRVQELQDFKSAFNMLKTKIRYTYAPLKDIFEDIARNVYSKTATVFEMASKYMDDENATVSWNRAVTEAELSITKEDKNAICELGKLLGKTDIDGQINEIELSLTFLENQIEKAEVEKNKNAKLYKSLGAITGIAIIIILL